VKTRYRPVALLFTVVAVWATAPAAQASDLHRTTAAYVIVGLGSPVGIGGLEIVHQFDTTFEVTAGVGSGLGAARAHNGSPLQWAVMPRLRLGDTWRNGLTLGAGMSGGNYGDVSFKVCDDYCDPEPGSYPVHYVVWANFEIGGEHRLRGGFAFRYFAGYAHGWRTDDPSRTLDFPYVGTGIGYAF
jgi:hypothetical protein